MGEDPGPGPEGLLWGLGTVGPGWQPRCRGWGGGRGAVLGPGGGVFEGPGRFEGPGSWWPGDERAQPAVSRPRRPPLRAASCGGPAPQSPGSVPPVCGSRGGGFQPGPAPTVAGLVSVPAVRGNGRAGCACPWGAAFAERTRRGGQL